MGDIQEDFEDPEVEIREGRREELGGNRRLKCLDTLARRRVEDKLEELRLRKLNDDYDF